MGHSNHRYVYFGHNTRRYGYLGHKFEYRLFVVLLFSTDWEFLTAGGPLDLIKIQISSYEYILLNIVICIVLLYSIVLCST